MDGLSSVSKGCFVVHGSKKSNHRVTNLVASSYLKTNEKAAEVRWQMAKEFWNTIEHKMKSLHANLTSKIFEDILDFLLGSSKIYNSLDISGTRTEIPTAALITGVNMPDHSELFHQLSDKVKAVISPHVAVLAAKQCTNMKSLMRCVGQQLILGETGEKLNSSVDDAENDLSGGCTKNVMWKKNIPLTMALLEQWYLQIDLEIKAKKSLKKKKQGRSVVSQKPIIIMLEDVEAFSSSLLHDFISMLSSLIVRVPVFLVFGVATSWSSVVDRQLTHSATVHLSLEKFHSPSSSHHLALIIDEILLTSEHPFKISGRCLELLLDVFLCHDFSVTNFLLNLKFCVFEHFYEEPASIFCTCSLDTIRENVQNVSSKDLNLLRKLPSIQSVLDALTSSQQKLHQSDDELFKKTFLGMLENIHQYHLCFFPVLRCLYTLCKSLPRHPLGRQVREVYCICARRNVTDTAEYKQAFLFLRVSSKEQLLERLQACVKDLQQDLNCQTPGNSEIPTENIKMTTFVAIKIPDLEGIIKRLSDLDDDTDVIEEEDEDDKEKDCSEVPIEQVKYAYQLQEKLKTRSKQKKIRKMTKFEKLRMKALDLLDEIFRKVLFPPSFFPLHEVFYFDSPIILKKHAIPSPRVSVQKALSDPHYYFQEQCLRTESAGVIPASAPDICIAFKLHNECGRMINLCDWLEAFYTIVSSDDSDNEVSENEEINEITQARFIQAASELQFLGFIKPTKRKTDHVQRLTWSHA